MSEGFLGRWARRKEAVRAAETTPVAVVGEDVTTLPSESAPPPALLPTGEAPIPALPADAIGPEAPIGEDPETILAELPSLDALTPETDLTPFLRTGVPTALRNAALRRMWSLDPSIRDFVSEAREYAYDWNTPGGVPGLGPLLPGDDVQAMLGRLFRGPDDAPAEEPASDTERADPMSSETPPPASPLPAPEGAEIAAAGEASASAPTGATQAKVASTEESIATAVDAAPSRPRLRRHGGAMPA